MVDFVLGEAHNIDGPSRTCCTAKAAETVCNRLGVVVTRTNSSANTARRFFVLFFECREKSDNNKKHVFPTTDCSINSVTCKTMKAPSQCIELYILICVHVFAVFVLCCCIFLCVFFMLSSHGVQRTALAIKRSVEDFTKQSQEAAMQVAIYFVFHAKMLSPCV